MSWWKEGVIYQIYPRSFQDSNADGIGDIRGIIQRLDYLNDGSTSSLGVSAIWLCPVYPSPQADFGYDVADYLNIDPCYGTLTDLDALIEAAHSRNIRVIMDMVLNHTSDQHPWFQQSLLGDQSDKQDWYIWHEGRQRPTNWESCFGGSGWSWSEQRQAWYYHSFLPQQPDLNWRNPAVVDAVRNVLEFWMERGIDGFRLDVVNYYFKDQQLRNNPVDWFKIARPYDRQRHLHDKDQPEMHEALQAMRQWVEQYPERILIGEVFTGDEDNCQLAASYCGRDDQLHLAFNLEFLHCRFDASAFKRAIKRWNEALGKHNWPCYTLSNHDVKRHISRYAASERTPWRARLLATMLLTLRGTPVLYYGEEIGMPEQRVPRKQLQDPVGLHYWPLFPGRDGCRRPMMWSKPNSFTSATTSWLPDDAESEHTVANQEYNPGSLLNWYRTLIWLRHQYPALSKGSMKLLESHPDILAWERCHNDQRILVLLNFSNRYVEVNIHRQILDNLLANSHDEIRTPEGNLSLQPLQALVVCLPDDFPQRAVI
ncbi:alpha-amylase family glycosyl hydrolase [Oceanobacter kriegii]|uniref:alpha-amylase family glycosyl hydrolase n=1 Tax=Oceanobacter kriegii TaxID=64972 RepID=UPI000567643F|nr:alpha-amylase family glycosyl hydrolase [Oceanobacter kriegii]